MAEHASTSASCPLGDIQSRSVNLLKSPQFPHMVPGHGHSSRMLVQQAGHDREFLGGYIRKEESWFLGLPTAHCVP